ncbi:MAG: cupin domain-containing protein [Patescibacteria group bacterium]
MPKAISKKNQNFISVFQFASDKSKPGRILSTVRIGDVFMSRLVISPGVCTGNYYHRRTKLMFYAESGQLEVVFENVKTKERQKITMKPARQVIHVPSYISFATKNISEEEAILVFFSDKPLRSDDSFEYKVM